jgi:hypothetical protein
MSERQSGCGWFLLSVSVIKRGFLEKVEVELVFLHSFRVFSS